MGPKLKHWRITTLTNAQRRRLNELNEEIPRLQYARRGVPCTVKDQPRWDALQAQIEVLVKEQAPLLALEYQEKHAGEPKPETVVMRDPIFANATPAGSDNG